MDKLSVMTAFCRIVERGSFARAAEDLGVSSALLSREVKLLEESLGTSLLTRTTRSMSLTDNGRQFYDEARDIVDAVSRAEEGIRQQAGEVRGPLKVNCSNSFGQSVIGPMLPEFLERYPDIRLTLSLDERVVDMVEAGIDVSIRVNAVLQDSSLVARKVGHFNQRVFASPAYLERHGAPDRPADVTDHRIIGFLMADHLIEWQFTGPNGSEAISIDPEVRIGNSLIMRDLIVAGHGIGTLPTFVSKSAEAAGEIVRVLPDYELPSREIFAVTTSRLGMDAKVTAFVDHLKTALAD